MKETEWQLRRDANFLGIGLLVLIVFMQGVFPVALLLLRILGIVSPDMLSQPFLGLGNTAYLLFYMVVYIVAMGMPFLLTALIAYRPIQPFGPAARVSPLTAVLGISGGLAVCVFANLIANYVSAFLDQLGLVLPPTPSFMENTPLSFFLNVLIVAVLPAFLEEMVFRGYVLRTLRPYGASMAIVVSAILFSLMHGTLQQIPFAFVVGLLLGFVVVQTNNIWLAVCIHFFNNFMAVCMEYANFSLSTSEQSNALYLLVLCNVALVGLFAIMGLCAKGSPLSGKVSAAPGELTAAQQLSSLFRAPAMVISMVCFLLLMILTNLL